MPLTKQQKQARLDSLAAELAGATTLIVTSFNAMTVEQDNVLRRQLRDAGGHYRVVKNTLVSRAAQGTTSAPVLTGLKGVNSIAYTSGDGVALAKALQDYAKANPNLDIKSGVIDGATLSAADVAQLALTPSKEELYAKLLYLIQAPAQRLAMVINAAGRNTAVVLDQAVQAKKFAE